MNHTTRKPAVIISAVFVMLLAAAAIGAGGHHGKEAGKCSINKIQSQKKQCCPDPAVKCQSADSDQQCRGCMKKGNCKGNQTSCPVMGGKINKEIFADHDGKRVYFCCNDCMEKFKKNPRQYIRKLEKQGVTPEKIGKPQTSCPVLGKKINKEIFADHDGKRAYFCCNDCMEKFKKNPRQYIRKLEEQGVTLEKIRKQQTSCPVIGGKINKEIFADHDGKRVYFCCSGCTEKFKKNPEQYIRKMEKDGVTLEEIK